jgi:TatD DNase family protein
MLVDTHCHIDYPDLAGENNASLPDVIARAAQAGVSRLVTISTHVRRFSAYAAIAEQFPNVFCTVGTHPHYAHDEADVSVNELINLSQHPRCIGLGEAGLDYYYDRSPRDVQMQVFRTHLAAARITGLPLVIHARQADDDMIQVLRDEMALGPFKAILHCFSSTAELAQVGIELGLYVSFSGIVTFKRSSDLRDVARDIPLNRLFVETDAPYLAPEPHRGRTCEPAYTALTARVLADVKGISLEALAKATTDNFYRLFIKAAHLDQVTCDDHP